MSFVIIAQHGRFWTLALNTQQDIFFFFLQSSKTDELQICFHSSIVPNEPRGRKHSSRLVLIQLFLCRGKILPANMKYNKVKFLFGVLMLQITNKQQHWRIFIIIIYHCKQYILSAPTCRCASPAAAEYESKFSQAFLFSLLFTEYQAISNCKNKNKEALDEADGSNSRKKTWKTEVATKLIQTDSKRCCFYQVKS